MSKHPGSVFRDISARWRGQPRHLAISQCSYPLQVVTGIQLSLGCPLHTSSEGPCLALEVDESIENLPFFSHPSVILFFCEACKTLWGWKVLFVKHVLFLN